MAVPVQVLLDTDRLSDALALGYEAKAPHEWGGLKVTFEDHPEIGPTITFNGADGEVQLIGEAEINAVLREVGLAVARSSTRRAAAPAFAMAAE